MGPVEADISMSVDGFITDRTRHAIQLLDALNAPQFAP
jgi:hypothetical protein